MPEPDQPHDGSEHTRAVFSAIYETDHWKGGSGEGSPPDATAPYREFVQRLLTARDVRTVVDVGCGDWQSSRLIDWRGVRYTGVDVVPEVVDADRERFGGPDVAFACADVTTEPAPRADLLLCKDVLQHWPNAVIRRFVARERRRHRYLVLTNDVWSVHWPDDERNADVPMGHWRTIDLEQPPFAIRADVRLDFLVGTEWRKRVLVVTNPLHRLRASLTRGSALAIARESVSPSSSRRRATP